MYMHAYVFKISIAILHVHAFYIQILCLPLHVLPVVLSSRGILEHAVKIMKTTTIATSAPANQHLVKACEWTVPMI